MLVTGTPLDNEQPFEHRSSIFPRVPNRCPRADVKSQSPYNADWDYGLFRYTDAIQDNWDIPTVSRARRAGLRGYGEIFVGPSERTSPQLGRIKRGRT